MDADAYSGSRLSAPLYSKAFQLAGMDLSTHHPATRLSRGPATSFRGIIIFFVQPQLCKNRESTDMNEKSKCNYIITSEISTYLYKHAKLCVIGYAWSGPGIVAWFEQRATEGQSLPG